MKVAVYPGTFDPITFGHLDVALRAAHLFDEVVIGIYRDAAKPSRLFSADERISFAEAAVRDEIQHSRHGVEVGNRVRVVGFSGLAVEFARSVGAQVIVRGLRAVSDFEYEFKLAHMNEHLASEIEVVCLMTNSRHAFVSSSLIREVASLGGDVSGLVPESVRRALVGRFAPARS